MEEPKPSWHPSDSPGARDEDLTVISDDLSAATSEARLLIGRLTSFELSMRPVTPTQLHRVELLQEIRNALARVAAIADRLRTTTGVDALPEIWLQEDPLAAGSLVHPIPRELRRSKRPSEES
jgi:hypothetical protein